MTGKRNLISTSAAIVAGHKRYVVWFYLLNLLFAWWGAGPFAASTHKILDHSLYGNKLLHGLDVSAVGELLARPEFGPMQSATAAAFMFAIVFFLVSLVFMPGILLGYASDHRISREEFFRACGRNLWRFLRVFLFFALIGGIVAGILFGIHAAAGKAAEQTVNDDRIPYFTKLGTLLIVFLGMTLVRAWFDLAQTDIVLHDQNAVRKSVSASFRMTRRHLGRLWGSYVVIALIGVVVLIGGLNLWHLIVPQASVLGAFLVSQTILLLLLAIRFWQRAVAVALYVRHVEQSYVMAETSALPASAV